MTFHFFTFNILVKRTLYYNIINIINAFVELAAFSTLIYNLFSWFYLLPTFAFSPFFFPEFQLVQLLGCTLPHPLLCFPFACTPFPSPSSPLSPSLLSSLSCPGLGLSRAPSTLISLASRFALLFSQLQPVLFPFPFCLAQSY